MAKLLALDAQAVHFAGKGLHLILGFTQVGFRRVELILEARDASLLVLGRVLVLRGLLGLLVVLLDLLRQLLAGLLEVALRVVSDFFGRRRSLCPTPSLGAAQFWM